VTPSATPNAKRTTCPVGPPEPHSPRAPHPPRLRGWLPTREHRRQRRDFLGVRVSVVWLPLVAGLIADQLAPLTDALDLLHRLGLYPIVLHGGGPQLNEALAEAGTETERIDGLG